MSVQSATERGMALKWALNLCKGNTDLSLETIRKEFQMREQSYRTASAFAPFFFGKKKNQRASIELAGEMVCAAVANGAHGLSWNGEQYFWLDEKTPASKLHYMPSGHFEWHYNPYLMQMAVLRLASSIRRVKAVTRGEVHSRLFGE